MKKLILGLCGLLSAATVIAAPIALDSIAASVNDEVITQSAVNLRMADIKKSLVAAHTAIPADDILRPQVLNQMITEQALLQMASQRGVNVDDNELNETLKDIAKRNNVSLTQMRAQIEKQGTTYAAFREDIKRQLVISRLEQQALKDQIIVTDREVDSYLAAPQATHDPNTRYHIAHILVALPENPSPAAISTAKQKADRIMAALKKGADFKQIAVSQSSDTQALQGGDLGWRTAAELPTLIADKVPKMATNAVMGPLRSAGGFHIVKLLERQHADGAVATTKDAAREVIWKRKYNEALQNWIQQVRDGAHVEIRT